MHIHVFKTIEELKGLYLSYLEFPFCCFGLIGERMIFQLPLLHTSEENNKKINNTNSKTTYLLTFFPPSSIKSFTTKITSER